MESIYVESTIPSYLAARRSSQEPTRSHQDITRDWWEKQKPRYRLYSSLAVRVEISTGDPSASAKRLGVMDGIPELDFLPQIEPLAISIIQILNLPEKAKLDATHLAFAIAHGIDYLLTWNCTHLANAALQKKLFEFCSYKRLHMPVICTPEYLTPPDL